MGVENFKRLSLSGDFSQTELGPIVDKFNNSFNSDEVQLFRNGNGYELWLRELSINYFDEVIRQLKLDSGDTAPLLDSIHRAVKEVGSYGLRGKKRLYVGYNRERKVTERKNKEIRRGKHYYANDHEFDKRHGRLPAEYTNQTVCGDSEQVLKNLPDNCIDLIFTSPPYNFGLAYQSSDDAIDWEAYFGKLFAVFDECIRVLKYGGRLVVNVQPLFSDYIPSHHVISNHLMDRRMIWKGEILWEKNNYNCKYTAWGSWKSPASPYLKYTWEFVEVFCKGDLKKAGASINADIDTESFKSWVLGKWSIAPERNMKLYGHPAMFPEELARRVLLLFSFKEDVILDPFMGVGTTCVAAKKFQRKYLGIDVSEEYCETADSRLSEFML